MGLVEALLLLLLSEIDEDSPIETIEAGTVVEQKVLVNTIHQSILHIGQIHTHDSTKDERRKQAVLTNLNAIKDGLNKQQLSMYTLNGLSVLMMDMSLYAGVGNVEESLKAARRALKYLGELKNVGKIDDNDFRSIGDRLKKYLASSNMDELGILGG